MAFDSLTFLVFVLGTVAVVGVLSFPILAYATTVLTVVFTVIVWRTQGLDKVPIWWDVHGGPCLWAPPWLGFLLVPLLAFVVSNALLLAIGSINLRSHGQQSKEAIRDMILLPAWFLLSIQFDILMSAMNPGDHKFPSLIFVSHFAALYSILGGLITRVEPNRVIGIITPWTNDSNWKALHQKAGVVFRYSVILPIVVIGFPIGWPRVVAVLVMALGPWIICWITAYLYAPIS